MSSELLRHDAMVERKGKFWCFKTYQMCRARLSPVRSHNHSGSTLFSGLTNLRCWRSSVDPVRWVKSKGALYSDMTGGRNRYSGCDGIDSYNTSLASSSPRPGPDATTFNTPEIVPESCETSKLTSGARSDMSQNAVNIATMYLKIQDKYPEHIWGSMS